MLLGKIRFYQTSAHSNRYTYIRFRASYQYCTGILSDMKLCCIDIKQQFSLAVLKIFA